MGMPRSAETALFEDDYPDPEIDTKAPFTAENNFIGKLQERPTVSGWALLHVRQKSTSSVSSCRNFSVDRKLPSRVGLWQ